MGNAVKPAICAAACTVLLAACASAAASTQSAAAGVTQAIYDDDRSSVLARVDASIAKSITRASVGAISDKMHALGQYKGLDQLASDQAKREYQYRANFTKGSMNVIVRVGPDGKLAAYRIYPNS